MTIEKLLDGWRISEEEIRAELNKGRKPLETVCLGCAAKLPLDIVYRGLGRLESILPHEVNLLPRADAYIFPSGGIVTIDRGVYSIEDILNGLNGEAGRVTEYLSGINPTGLVVLTSLRPNTTSSIFLEAMQKFYEAAARAGKSFEVGKGHTLQIATTSQQQFILADWVSSLPGGLYGVVNNDTISTIDPNLEHFSWISVYVALNNAFNDLFLLGVHKNLKAYPSYDGRNEEETAKIKLALESYRQRFTGLGLEIVEQMPLGYGTKAIGATVLGTTDREVPRNGYLEPGQVLIASRAIGDLAPLTEYLIREYLGGDLKGLEALRVHVLREMLTPNYEAAKIIYNHLPRIGEPFDLKQHITATRDMSGPGILVLEELAEDSKVNIYLEDIVFHENQIIPRVQILNPTAGTNGAIVMAAHPKLAEVIISELRKAGYSPWVIGHVLEKSNEPTIYLNPQLRRYASRERGKPYFLEPINPITDQPEGLFKKYVFQRP